MENGTYIKSNVIYTVNSLQNCDWHIVGVCYVDEMITNKVEHIEEENGKSLYKADFYYNNVYYLFIGEMEKEEFDEIIKKMIF